MAVSMSIYTVSVKDVANETANTAFMPECASAIGACSRLEPHPKFFPATIIASIFMWLQHQQ